METGPAGDDEAPGAFAVAAAADRDAVGDTPGGRSRASRAGLPVGPPSAVADVLHTLLATVRADLFRLHGSSTNRLLARSLAGNVNFRFIAVLRTCRALSHSRDPLLRVARLPFVVAWRYYKMMYGFSIPYGTDIGPGFYINHHGTIVVNGGAVIGANCNLHPGVTIGQANRGSRKGVPVIGDRVWIGPGAVIVGAVRIGSDVLIGPNAFVNSDVPDGVVVSAPAGIIVSSGGTEGYIDNPAEPTAS
jgi:serine O-acetyltransferase